MAAINGANVLDNKSRVSFLTGSQSREGDAFQADWCYKFGVKGVFPLNPQQESQHSLMDWSPSAARLTLFVAFQHPRATNRNLVESMKNEGRGGDDRREQSWG